MSAAESDILILDDGELREVREAADALGAAVHSDFESGEAPISWPLVVTSPRYLDALDALPINLNAKRIVVLDHLSHTLRARMKRSRIDFVLRRPVHPEALRLLLLHCLYDGPERRQRRVAVGAPIRFRLGFRKSDGVLADLSLEGCRILCDEPLDRGARPLVFLPRPDRKGRSFHVRAEVVRVQKRLGRQPEMALRFQSVGRGASRRIAELLMLYDEGPAVFRGAAKHAPAPPVPTPEARDARDGTPIPERPPEPAVALPLEDPGDALAEAADDRFVLGPADSTDLESAGEESPEEERSEWSADADDEIVGAPASFQAPAPVFSEEDREFDDAARASMDAEVEAALAPHHATMVPEESDDAPPRSALPAEEPGADSRELLDERRREPRREFNRQVVALDRSARRILVGRDLSVGGMRVDANDALTPRKSFRLSIHVRQGEVPLVLRARVARDDGEDGILLRFDPLSFAVQEQLRKSLRELPILATGDGEEPEAVLLTEMIDKDPLPG